MAKTQKGEEKQRLLVRNPVLTDPKEIFAFLKREIKVADGNKRFLMPVVQSEKRHGYEGCKLIGIGTGQHDVTVSFHMIYGGEFHFDLKDIVELHVFA